METRTTHEVTKEVDLFGKNKFTSLTEHLLFEPIAVTEIAETTQRSSMHGVWQVEKAQSYKINHKKTRLEETGA